MTAFRAVFNTVHTVNCERCALVAVARAGGVRSPFPFLPLPLAPLPCSALWCGAALLAGTLLVMLPLTLVYATYTVLHVSLVVYLAALLELAADRLAALARGSRPRPPQQVRWATRIHIFD